MCIGQNPTILFNQKFAQYSEGSLMAGYDVVICKSCGAGYADDIPEQGYFDRYYAEMSKYEHSESSGKVSQYDANIFSKTVDFLLPHIKKTDSIADIGCATGALLSELKKRGFSKVVGYDPSKECCDTARRLYDVEVRQSTISQLATVKEKYDLVMMTGVLEHLSNVELSVATLIKMLNPGGQLFIAVPDASRYQNWFTAPYQFFSMEHINFFSPQSLSNLMSRHGLKARFIERTPRYLAKNSVEPILMGLFGQFPSTNNNTKFTRDNETESALNSYIQNSRATDDRIKIVINQLVQSQEPLIIWGAATHTLRLMKTSDLSKANIVSIIDSNKNYHHKKLHGIEIIAPHDCVNKTATILISTQVAENEIKSLIRDQLRWTNKLICLYENEPVELKN